MKVAKDGIFPSSLSDDYYVRKGFWNSKQLWRPFAVGFCLHFVYRAVNEGNESYLIIQQTLGDGFHDIILRYFNRWKKEIF